ncbi:predicted protein [Paecilomyces variotii No. 5]|uniref:Uncharacterized protein n=1 Tax=Byssochlamys spectabilis (strain No. 5 / NBRC 109023) TaxID=1356009 RepID=V5FY88_BYSSN|nr:predicted protein [Paecilomyces variotii No. 5]
MFDLPDAKRVRRDELTSPPSSPAPSSPALSTNDANERLGKLLGFEIPPLDITLTGQATGNPEPVDAVAPEEEEQEFEFRLFSSAPAKQKTEGTDSAGISAETTGNENAERTQKLRIRIRSPTPGDVSVGEGRFVVPFRGWEYYFTTPTLLGGHGKEDVARAEEKAAAKRAEFEDIAVSQTQLFEWAKQPWPGCHLPWRVIRLDRAKTKLPRPSADPTLIHLVNVSIKASPKSRKKPGKKRRLVLRKRAAAAEAAKLSEAEKRNKRNREKKIKRRQKAREQKAALAGAGGSTQASSVADGDSGADD